MLAIYSIYSLIMPNSSRNISIMTTVASVLLLIFITFINSKAYGERAKMTDEFRGYDPLRANNFVHLRVDHQHAFSDLNGTHTNNIESFWATVKRGVYGIYHHISVEYMQRYVDEFCFRYNNRKEDMFGMVLKQSVFNAA